MNLKKKVEERREGSEIKWMNEASLILNLSIFYKTWSLTLSLSTFM